jgi:hypothetical protein
MDTGAEHASRRKVREATIVELYVDEQPAFVPTARLTGYASAARLVMVRYRSLVRWVWLTPLLILVVWALWFTVGSAKLDSAQYGVEMGDIERTVGSDLSGQLLGDLRVDSVRCVRRTRTDARCVAQLFDKSGDGPITQSVTVSIEQDSGDYFLNAGPAY